ncbi:hypothetical protein [Streptomyces canus]|nr:hypothetical protein [Streptomyces canus]
MALGRALPQRLKNPLMIKTPGSHEALFTRPADLADAFVRAGAA